MHSAPLHVVNQLLTMVRPAAPWSDRFELTVIPLVGRGPPVALPRALSGESSAALLEEHTPPRADVVRGSAPAGSFTIARLGDVLNGGMANRAVLRTTRIDGDEGVELPVIPVESRWWGCGGTLAVGGVLPASLVAVVALASRGGGAVTRAGALTAAWSADLGDAGMIERRVRGFVLLAGERAIALHVSSHDMTIAGGVDLPVGKHGLRLTAAAQVRRYRDLVGMPGASITVGRSAPPVDEAWILDAGGLLSAVADHQRSRP